MSDADKKTKQLSGLGVSIVTTAFDFVCPGSGKALSAVIAFVGAVEYFVGKATDNKRLEQAGKDLCEIGGKSLVGSFLSYGISETVGKLAGSAVNTYIVDSISAVKISQKTLTAVEQISSDVFGKMIAGGATMKFGEKTKEKARKEGDKELEEVGEFIEDVGRGLSLEGLASIIPYGNVDKVIKAPKKIVKEGEKFGNLFGIAKDGFDTFKEIQSYEKDSDNDESNGNNSPPVGCAIAAAGLTIISSNSCDNNGNSNNFPPMGMGAIAAAGIGSTGAAVIALGATIKTSDSSSYNERSYCSSNDYNSKNSNNDEFDFKLLTLQSTPFQRSALVNAIKSNKDKKEKINECYGLMKNSLSTKKTSFMDPNFDINSRYDSFVKRIVQRELIKQKIVIPLEDVDKFYNAINDKEDNIKYGGRFGDIKFGYGI